MKFKSEEELIWYSSLIYDSLKAGLQVGLYIVPDGDMEGCLGVKIDDVEFPYFAWESFEEQVESEEERKKAELVMNKIVEKNEQTPR